MIKKLINALSGLLFLYLMFALVVGFEQANNIVINVIHAFGF